MNTKDFEALLIKAETDWGAKLQLPTRIITFDTQPDVKEYILSEKEILTLNEQLVKDTRQQLLKAVEEMGKKYQSPLAEEVKDRVYDCDVTSWNQALSAVIDLLKAKDNMEGEA